MGNTYWNRKEDNPVVLEFEKQFQPVDPKFGFSSVVGLADVKRILCTSLMCFPGSKYMNFMRRAGITTTRRNILLHG